MTGVIRRNPKRTLPVLPDHRGNLFVNLVIALGFLTIGYGIFTMEFDLYVPTESQGAETITAGIRG